jgi:hypothetical protein
MTDTPTTPPNNEPQRQGGFLAFWTTLPGILTGVAAVITAIAGLISYWQTTGTSTGNANQPTQQTAAQQPTHTPTSATSQPNGTTPTRTVAQANGIRARGRINLNRGDQADLEQGLVAITPNSDLSFGPETTPNLFATASAFLAPTDLPPSKRVCRAALTHRHDAFEILPTLDTKWICVSTTEGHIAAVTVIRTPGVGNPELDLGYTVWR